MEFPFSQECPLECFFARKFEGAMKCNLARALPKKVQECTLGEYHAQVQTHISSRASALAQKYALAQQRGVRTQAIARIGVDALLEGRVGQQEVRRARV